MPTYQSPGVYIEEISAGPRPVQASGTSSTGFVGVLELPNAFSKGLNALTVEEVKAEYANVLMPVGINEVQASWNVGRHYYPLGWLALAKEQDDKDDAALATKITEAQAAVTAAGDDEAKKKKAQKELDKLLKERDAREARAPAVDLDSYIKKILGTNYSVAPPDPDVAALVKLSGKNDYVLEADRTLVNLHTDQDVSAWNVSLAVSLNPRPLIDRVGARAARLGEAFSGTVPGIKGDEASVTVDFDSLRNALAEPAALVTGMDSFRIWRQEFGRKLFTQMILTRQGPSTDNTLLPEKQDQVHDIWRALSDDIKDAWHAWIRGQRGMRMLELAVGGFFANGGSAAYLAMTVVPTGLDLADKNGILKQWFDTVGDVALMCAAGLNKEWQSAILDYCRMPAPAGRGDIFAILDTPRYLLTKPPGDVDVSPKDRWVEGAGAYAVGDIEFLPAPEVPALRYAPNDTQMDQCVPRDANGFGAAYAPWLIVRNPLATGNDDAFVVAPPSGHMAGCYALNDSVSGVQKVPANQPVGGLAELVAAVTAVEQNPLNVKGLNVIRYRPGGILIWGGRTTTTDPLWRYINIRRVFLFIERSVRDAVQWAVFLPNNAVTRSDLRSTIGNFLYAQWQRGVLDGANDAEAFAVQCDEDNNPLSERKAGFLNCDVGLQPPYPAEFVVIRFRQQA